MDDAHEMLVKTEQADLAKVEREPISIVTPNVNEIERFEGGPVR